MVQGIIGVSSNRKPLSVEAFPMSEHLNMQTLRQIEIKSPFGIDTIQILQRPPMLLATSDDMDRCVESNCLSPQHNCSSKGDWKTA